MISSCRAVLDTNVVLDLFVWQNPEAMPLHDAITQGRIVCLSDNECLDELERVLAYPKLALDPETRLRIFRNYVDRVEHPTPRPFFKIVPHCNDRDDQKFLVLAVHQRADILLTRDKALLRLAKRVRKIAPQLQILTPRAFLLTS